MRRVGLGHLYLFTGEVFAASRFLFLLLCALCVLSGESLSQDFKQVHPGVEYAQVEHKIGSDPVKINLLRLDLTKVRLDVHHAMDAAIGLERTSSIAIRHGGVAGINAGFFRLDTSIFAGDSTDALQIDKRLYSEGTRTRVSLFIKNDALVTKLEIGRIALWPQILIGKREIRTSGINRERKNDELIVYTPDFGRTTLTSAGGVEVIVRQGKIRSVERNLSSNAVPADGFVISATGKAADEILRTARVGLSSEMFTNSAFLKRKLFDYLSEDIVGGVPQLINNGNIDITWEQEKASKSFAETRHPRTAVAKLKDGKFLMVTVDGRQPGVSVGMSLQELAEYLLSLGAVDAMNLDGGGSTTMYLDGKVVNTPSDKTGERKIGDAIVVTLRKK